MRRLTSSSARKVNFQAAKQLLIHSQGLYSASNRKFHYTRAAEGETPPEKADRNPTQMRGAMPVYWAGREH